MTRSYTIGRVVGVPLCVHPSLALMCAPVALLSLQAARSTVGDIHGTGVLLPLLLGPVIYCLSLAAHELGHLVVLRRYGVPVEKVTLNAWGGRTRVPGAGPEPAVDAAVAAGGPAVTLLLSAIGLGGFFALTRHGSGRVPAEEVALLLTILNLMLLPGCLIPAWPADGYRVARGLLWALCGNAAVATRLASWLSLAAVALLLEMGALSLHGPAAGGMAGTMLLGTGAVFLLPARRVVNELRTVRP